MVHHIYSYSLSGIELVVHHLRHLTRFSRERNQYLRQTALPRPKKVKLKIFEKPPLDSDFSTPKPSDETLIFDPLPLTFDF